VGGYKLDLVFEQSYNRNKARPEDFASLIDGMKAARPEVAIFGSYLNDSVALLKEAKAKGFAPDIMVFSFGPALYEFGAMVGIENAEGALATSQWQRGQHMPGAFDFSFRFKKRTGRNASYPAAGAYASGQVVEAAARLAGRGRTVDEYRDQLRNMTFRSLLGPYRVDETGLQTGKPIFVLQWQNGRRELVYPEAFAREPIIYPLPAWEAR
jgi:branched-chain amino acid transport system substrate-binding protein